jgi:hypothetical protein
MRSWSGQYKCWLAGNSGWRALINGFILEALQLMHGYVMATYDSSIKRIAVTALPLLHCLCVLLFPPNTVARCTELRMPVVVALLSCWPYLVPLHSLAGTCRPPWPAASANARWCHQLSHVPRQTHPTGSPHRAADCAAAIRPRKCGYNIPTARGARPAIIR